MQRVTMMDVARELGMSQATVSRALRNHGSVSGSTKARVQAAAKRLGYAPNPLVSALMESRRRRAEGGEVGMTYIEADASRSGLLGKGKIYRRLYEGMAQRAKELGYVLNRMDAFEPGVNPARFRSVLKSRGIENVIVSPLFGGIRELDIGFDRLRAVSVGLSLASPALHRVRSNHFANAELVVDRVLARGHRRLGFVHDVAGGLRLGNRWLAAYLAAACGREDVFFAPPLLTPDHVTPLEELLGRYLEIHRPEVLITPDHIRTLAALDALSVKVPQDIRLASVNAFGGERGISGIDEDFSRQGWEIVNLLAGEILHGQFGVPERPREIVVAGRWVEGRS